MAGISGCDTIGQVLATWLLTTDDSAARNRLFARLSPLDPVAYAEGLSVINPRTTVTWQGNVYIARPDRLPFTTGAELDPLQWRMILNNGTGPGGWQPVVAELQAQVDELELAVATAPGTLADLANGPALDPAAGFPEVLSVENSLGPVDAVNESIGSLTARTKQLRDDQTAATEALARPDGAGLVGAQSPAGSSITVGQAISRQAVNFLTDFCTNEQAAAIRSGNTAVDLSSAWARMLSAMAAGARCVFFPEGTYSYSTDIRILWSRVRLVGVGGGTILRATNNARLILGEAIPVTGGSKPVKSGTKVVGTLIEKLRFQPAANHAGEVILVDFADNTKLRDIPQINPAQNNGSARTDGVKLRWVQWFYMDNCEIQVNGYCVYILLEASDRENEDHFAFKDCNFFASKVPVSGVDPVGILFERDPARNAPVWQWGCDSVHFGKFTDANAGVMHGVATKTTFASDNVTVAGGTLVNCWFEAVDYPVDLRTFQQGAVADGSFFTSNGCTYMGATKVAYGGDFSKCSISFVGSMYIQCGQIGQGIRMHWTGNNRISQPSGSGASAISFEGISRHRLSNRATGASSLDSVRLAAVGTATIAAGATTAVVTHQLAVNGSGLTPDNILLSPNFAGRVYPTSIGATTFTITVDASDPAARTVNWSAQLAEN